jgi:methionyl-tRNA formyltransferase
MVVENMKIALIMNSNSYCGREYSSKLTKANIKFDLLVIKVKAEGNPVEEERCGGLWTPPEIDELNDNATVHQFTSLKSEEFLSFLSEKSYDLGIQGGTGILRQNVIDAFGLGILNFHPGDLPYYRGCSAPEWQLVEKKPVVSTCHLVDTGIDTGKIIDKQELSPGLSSYHDFRSSIYPQTADFVVDIVSKYIEANGHFTEPQVQDESDASYRKYIGDEKIEDIKLMFPLD